MFSRAQRNEHGSGSGRNDSRRMTCTAGGKCLICLRPEPKSRPRETIFQNNKRMTAGGGAVASQVAESAAPFEEHPPAVPPPPALLIYICCYLYIFACYKTVDSLELYFFIIYFIYLQPHIDLIFNIYIYIYI